MKRGKIGFDESEEAVRAQWRALVAERGLTPFAAPPVPGFTGRVMAEVRAGCGASGRHAFLMIAWRRRAAVAAACAAALAAVLCPILASRGAGQSPVARNGEARGAEASDASSAADRLASRQRQDGTWAEAGAGESFRPALTALAAMALSGAGPAGRPSNVASAVAALEAMQNADGSFGAPGPHSIYNHAFAAFALIDDARRNGKGMTRAIERALAFSLASQNAGAAWGYPGAQDCDDALTVWELGVLSAARGLGWRDGQGALRRGLAALGRRIGGGLPDFRFALGRESTPDAGGAILTAIASDAIAGCLDAMDCRGSPAEGLIAAIAPERLARMAGETASALPDRHGVYGTAVAILAESKAAPSVK